LGQRLGKRQILHGVGETDASNITVTCQCEGCFEFTGFNHLEKLKVRCVVNHCDLTSAVQTGDGFSAEVEVVETMGLESGHMLVPASRVAGQAQVE
jgi:hypothetical protein